MRGWGRTGARNSGACLLAALVYAVFSAFDAARFPAQAQFFDELFGGGRDRGAFGAWGRDDDEAASRRRRRTESAREARARSARPFFRIARIGENTAPAQVFELRWGRGVNASIRPSFAPPAVVTLGYPASESNGPRLICVRACDGAVVSLAKYGVADIARQHPGCDNACPGAETRLYRMPEASDDMSAAVDVGSKTTYAELLARLSAATDKKPACSCGSVIARTEVGVERFLADPTLQYGDIVATSGGLKMFRGGPRATHRASDFVAYRGPLGSVGERLGTLAAINRMLKAPDARGFSAAIQFGPR